MKLMHEHIDFPLQSAVKVKWRNMPRFTYPWHFHSEYEILYVIDGGGTSFVADNIEQFESGDLALLGSNLPHFWRSGEEYYSKNNFKKINYIVIQFPANLFNETLFQYPEFKNIRQLLDRSGRGIRYLSPFKEKAGKKIIRIAKSEGLKRLIYLMELLEEFSRTADYKLLAEESYHKKKHDFTNDRMTKVLHFLNTSYRQKIDLEEVAGIASLHPAAFCRYFREETGKTLSEYVKDMRISYACRLILDRKLSISQICYESGYNNLSNFNRAFKRQTGYTPTDYFQEFHRK